MTLRFCLLLVSCVALLGCRLSRYELTEPLDGQAIQVKSGDRISVVLEENATTGYVWTPECDDDDISFARETVPPDETKPMMCGAPGKVRIIIRVHRGFDGPTHVKLAYKRPWKGGGTARTIDLLLYHKAEDSAPWKS